MSATAVHAPIGATEHTGGILGDRLIFDQWGAASVDASQAQHTAFAFTGSDSYVLSTVLPAWDEVLPRSVPDPVLERAKQVAQRAISWIGSVIRVSGDRLLERSGAWLAPVPANAEVMTASDAVRFVKSSLGVPVTAVLEACGIARRTFYSWEPAGITQPRLSSQGQLWKLVQITEDLVSILGDDLARWMKVEPRRQAWLASGAFDDLIADVMTERRVRVDSSTGSEPSSAVGLEIELPNMSEPRVPRNRANVTRYQRPPGRNGSQVSQGS